MKRISRAAILVLACAPASPAIADESGAVEMDPEARQALQDGLAHFERDEFELAIDEFQAGYEIDPRPEFLFALGQAERLSGDCRSAIVYYQSFLETGPAERQAEAARAMQERCARALESSPAGAAAQPLPDRPDDPAAEASAESGGAPDVPPPDPAAASAESAERARASRAPWYRDPLTDTLLAGGAIALTAGVGFFVSAGAAADDAQSADSYGDYERRLSAARSRRRAGWILFGAGAGLAAGAAYRIFRHERERQGPEVSVSAGDGSVGLLLRGAF